jgi:hypothetical protein
MTAVLDFRVILEAGDFHRGLQSTIEYRHSASEPAHRPDGFEPLATPARSTTAARDVR